MARRGPMNEDELLNARIRRYLREQGFRIETVGPWDRTDRAFAAIVMYTERERHLAEILLTDPRSILDVTVEEGNKIYIEINKAQVAKIPSASAQRDLRVSR